MTKKNGRSLCVIAAESHGLRGQSLFQIGDLLSEAKDSCEFGEWREWLEDEFEWSHDTADRYIAVAKLGVKCRKLRQLKLPKTTLYRLAELPDEEQPAIIAELAKRAGKHLSAKAAEDVITLARLRNQHGDLPDATLLALDAFDCRPTSVWHDKAIAELKRKKPTTEEEATVSLSAFSVHMWPSYSRRTENCPTSQPMRSNY
jgi:hypothetical protein